jgi:hypothetical protein
VILAEPVGWSTAVGFALVAAGCWLSTRPVPVTAEPEPVPVAAASAGQR